MRILLTSIILICATGCASVPERPPEEKSKLIDFDAMWNFNDPGLTESRFKELLPEAKSSGNPSHYGQLLTQIARSQGLQGKFEEAHETLSRAKSLLKSASTATRIRYLLEKGRVYNSSGRKDRAVPLFEEAWETAVSNDLDHFAVDAAHMLGIAESPEKQLAWNLKALELAEKSEEKSVKGWLGPLYNNIGWTYHDMEQYDEALELFEKSLAWRKKINDDQGRRIAQWTIAHTYRLTGRVNEAIDLLRALEKEIEENGLTSDGYVFEELAESLLLLGRQDEAMRYFKKAYLILSQDEWLSENEPERLERLKKIGNRI